MLPGLLQLYAKNYLRVTQNGIEPDNTKFYEGGFKAGLDRLEVKTTEVQPLSEDMALSTGEAHVTGKSEKGDSIEINVIWTALDVRENGQWKIRMLGRSASAKAFLIVMDIVAARATGRRRRRGRRVLPRRPGRPGQGLHPERLSRRSRALFSDPDGNGWHLQEITAPDPLRVGPAATSLASASDLASALRRAEAAHGVHEKRIGQRDANWPDWYAAYMVAEQSGKELPQ